MLDNETPSFFKRKPNFDLEQFISKDGKNYVIKFTTTWVIPIQYVLAIFKNRFNTDETGNPDGNAA
ncbi:MAG: hypothetical protein COT73_11200 [Bdellovibrio sp. CG10_big_fil_rev_8_21_14_0_10_47_8]|nr:MAG: hypothetical protein COT73_11200 [Bdellovibrio sp. CG10_big_fil_rev_8_21_14_0_10_47_8]